VAWGVVWVAVVRRVGLGSVLGYLAAGLAIGKFGLGLFSDGQTILHVAELGVVIFLFVIGLEMKPSHLWHLRRQIFGLGSLQVVIAAALILWVGAVAPEAFLQHFIVFVLSCVIGYYVVWNVSHSLHTPLMAVTNAISGIIVVGALLQIGAGGVVSFLAFIAVLLASINIFGGFFVVFVGEVVG